MIGFMGIAECYKKLPTEESRLLSSIRVRASCSEELPESERFHFILAITLSVTVLGRPGLKDARTERHSPFWEKVYCETAKGRHKKVNRAVWQPG